MPTGSTVDSIEAKILKALAEDSRPPSSRWPTCPACPETPCRPGSASSKNRVCVTHSNTESTWPPSDTR